MLGQSCQRLACFLVGGILLGNCVFLSAADGIRVTDEASPANPAREIERWIDRLGSERFQDREQATQELSKLGQYVLPNLKQAAKSADAEVRRRAQELIERTQLSPDRPAEPRFQPPIDAKIFR